MNKSIHFAGQPTFSQLIKLLPKEIVAASVDRNNSDRYYKHFTPLAPSDFNAFLLLWPCHLIARSG